MSVRTKGRRKIRVNNKKYIWYIELDYDSEHYILNIISEDKSLIVACPLKMKNSYIISKGIIFQNEKKDGCWKRYLLPFFVPEIITPKFVKELIFWADQGKNAIEVVWDGRDIAL